MCVCVCGGRGRGAARHWGWRVGKRHFLYWMSYRAMTGGADSAGRWSMQYSIFHNAVLFLSSRFHKFCEINVLVGLVFVNSESLPVYAFVHSVPWLRACEVVKKKRE